MVGRGASPSQPIFSVGRASGYGQAVPDAPAPSAPRRPPALTASVVFGVIGVVVLLVGLATSSTPVLVVSGLMGALSLASALVWRSQLIDAWRRDHPR